MGEQKSRSASNSSCSISKQIFTPRISSRLFTSPFTGSVSSPTDHTALLVAVGQAMDKEGEWFQSYLVRPTETYLVPVLLENPVGTAAFLKSLMFITRDVKNTPPYQHTSLVVCGGNISSSSAWQKRVWAQLSRLGPHLLHRHLSSLPAEWGCQKNLELLEESSGSRVRMELNKTQFSCCPISGYMPRHSTAPHCTAQTSPHPSLQRHHPLYFMSAVWKASERK